MNLFETIESIKELETQQELLDSQTYEDTLESLMDNFEYKAENVASWIERNNKEIELFKEKAKNFREEIPRLEALNVRLNNLLKDAMDALGWTRMVTDNHIITTRNYKASVVIDDEEEIPSEFKYTKEETKIDKQAIYDRLKQGKDVPGAELKENRKAVIK